MRLCRSAPRRSWAYVLEQPAGVLKLVKHGLDGGRRTSRCRHGGVRMRLALGDGRAATVDGAGGTAQPCGGRSPRVLWPAHRARWRRVVGRWVGRPRCPRQRRQCVLMSTRRTSLLASTHDLGPPAYAERERRRRTNTHVHLETEHRRAGLREMTVDQSSRKNYNGMTLCIVLCKHAPDRPAPHVL